MINCLHIKFRFSLSTMNTTCSEFSPSANKAGGIAVDTLFEHFKDNHNPFDFSIEKVINFVTGKFIDPDLTENLIHSITIGDGVYSVLNHHDLKKELLSCLTQSQEQKLQ